MMSSIAWLLLGQGVKYVIDQGFVNNNTVALQNALFAVLGVVMFGSVATFFRFYWMVWLGERVCADIRRNLFDHLVGLPPKFFQSTRTGEIISRFTSDTTLLQSVVGTGVSMALRSLVMFVGALFLMAFTSWSLTLMVFIAVPLILVPIRVLGAKVRTHSKLSQDTVAQVGAMVDESLHEIHTVQSYNHQTRSSVLFSEKVESVMAQAKRRIYYRALLISVVMVISLSAIFAVAYVGALSVIDGTLSAGQLTAFVFYAVLAGGAIATISEVVGELQKAAGASERIIELLNQTPDLKDTGKLGFEDLIQGKGPAVCNNNSGESSEPLDPKRSNVEPPIIQAKEICFAYPQDKVLGKTLDKALKDGLKQDIPGSRVSNEDLGTSASSTKYVIDKLSFSVKAGQKVAIVGHSGAGKSTLFELLQRFYDIDHGTINLFGHPIESIQLDSVRQLFALVPQDPVIFAGSVADNIAFSKPNASIEEIKKAAKLAYADEFIEQLPNTYHSELGERGVKLSGGQRQRIAIARAIVSERPILLLDEATSALDAQSEQLVKKALETLMSSKTTLIIAHRLSTVVHADNILVLEQGSLVATGSHKSLYQTSSVYKEFVDLQLVD